MSFRVLCDAELVPEEASSAQSSEQIIINSGSARSQYNDDSWKTRQTDTSHFNENRQTRRNNIISLGGLGKEVVNQLKKSAHDQELFFGKRKPLGDVVSAGREKLQAIAASKQELEKIHRKLTDIC